MVNPILPIALFASYRIGSKMPTTGITTSCAAASSSSLLPPLLDINGAEMTPSDTNERLQNKRVAFYFAAGWCPMCTSFEPALMQFREAASQSGKPVEIVYVGSDRSDSDQAKRAGGMEMMSIPFDGAAALKQKYNVWAGSETLKFGFGRRSGVPALVVLDQKGEEMAFVAAESQGVRSLDTWPVDDESGVWGV